MASAGTLTLSAPCCPPTKLHINDHHPHHLLIRFQVPRFRHRLRSSRRFLNYSQEGHNLVADPANWSNSSSRSRSRAVITEDYDDEGTDDEDEDDEDRSLDLLVRFVQNMFRKISRRARKAVRSVLPLAISTKLVGFSVNGVIILAFLWVLKAFLEVICTLGSVVFVSILLIRGIWSGVSYFQESRNGKVNDIDDDHRAWTGAQPAT